MSRYQRIPEVAAEFSPEYPISDEFLLRVVGMCSENGWKDVVDEASRKHVKWTCQM